jgi:2-phosphoglycerate kinase
MIYLIGGAPRLGKSILAKELMKKIEVPWISTDALRTTFYEMTDPAIRDEKFPFCGSNEGGAMEERYSIPEMVEKQLKEVDSMEQGIISFVMHHVGVKDDLILEGVHLTPMIVEKLQKKIPVNQLRVLYLASRDEAIVIDGMKKNTSHYDWAAGHSDEMKRKTAQFVVAFSAWVSADATERSLPVLTRSMDFKQDIKTALKKLR